MTQTKGTQYEQLVDALNEELIPWATFETGGRIVVIVGPVVLRGIVGVRRTVVLRLLCEGLRGKRDVINGERGGEAENER